ncbi:MAG: GatB/YqeY domain-containing protein [Bacteriovoracaceae bacterium]|nr:GatB/YqeY domain-containing protein [Bacteriovoracaceae bacterium]
MFEQINEDIKTAMKNKDKVKLEALRYLKAMLIENKTSGAPKPEQDVVIAHAKKLKDSIATYPEGHEQREKIIAEIACLKDYLPTQMSKADVVALINSIKAKQSNPNMGTIMKELSPQIKGKFDGKEANDLVKAALA